MQEVLIVMWSIGVVAVVPNPSNYIIWKVFHFVQYEELVWSLVIAPKPAFVIFCMFSTPRQSFSIRATNKPITIDGLAELRSDDGLLASVLLYIRIGSNGVRTGLIYIFVFVVSQFVMCVVSIIASVRYINTNNANTIEWFLVVKSMDTVRKL